MPPVGDRGHQCSPKLRRRLQRPERGAAAARDDDPIVDGVGTGLFCDERSLVAHHDDLRAACRRGSERRRHRRDAATLELQREQERVIRLRAHRRTGGRIDRIGPQRRESSTGCRDVAEPVAQAVDVVGAERPQNPAALGFAGHPRERARFARDVAVEEELDRAEAEAADVAVGEELLDVRALRRVAEFMADHRRLAARAGSVVHRGCFVRVERERLFAEHVLARSQRGDGERRVCARRRRDRDGVEVVSLDQLQRVRVHVRDAGRCGGRDQLVARAAAERDDIETLGAERGNIDLHTESEADDPDATVC